MSSSFDIRLQIVRYVNDVPLCANVTRRNIPLLSEIALTKQLKNPCCHRCNGMEVELGVPTKISRGTIVNISTPENGLIGIFNAFECNHKIYAYCCQ